MAETSLAKSIFSRTPDETTLVEDVYKKTSITPVNSFQDITKTGFELSEEFSFLSTVTSEKILQDAAGDMSIDKESITDKISSAFSGEYGKAKSLVSGLVAGSKAAIAEVKSKTNTVTGLLKQAQSVKATVNGIVSTVKTGNLKNLRNVADTINAISGKVSVSLSANGALSGIFTSLVGEAGTAGIKDSFGVVAASIKDASNITDTSKLLYQVASGSLPAAIKRGDLKSITSMADTLGKGAVSMMQPDVLKVLSKTNKDSFTPSQIGGANGQFVEYQGAYQKINPTWTQSVWKPLGTTAPVKDLTTLLGAAKETKDIFSLGSKMSSDPATKYLTVIDKFTKAPTVSELFKKNFPAAPVSTTNIYSKDVDPRLFETTIT